MAENLRFKSVAEASAFLAEDDTVNNLVQEEIANSQIVNNLLRLRMRKGISQKELSKAMMCDSSKISRIEAGNDLQLKIGDVMQYASALGVEVNVTFEDTSLPAAEQIKNYVFSIHNQLEQLVEIAKQVDGDKLIIDKIKTFYGEVLLNFMLRFSDSHQKLNIVSTQDLPPNGDTLSGKGGVKGKKTSKTTEEIPC